MKRFALFLSLLSIVALMTITVNAVPIQMSDAELIADAESAAPATIAKSAAIKTMDGRVLRQGSSRWTCYPGNEMAGPMCNEAQWDALFAAFMKKESPVVKEFSVSYMLAGEGDAMGVSNTDPFATEPTDDNDWVKEGPHLMILVPDPKMLEGLSTDPKDPVYVMWKGTPYAHIMVRIAEEE
ncbi:MAG TPA: hypothetical protein VGC53_01120 [Vicinamibacteria bacterium]|jgi:hypothetical protein